MFEVTPAPNPPAPGLYLVRLARGGHVLTAKVLVVH
jgi:hypothetical protein